MGKSIGTLLGASLLLVAACASETPGRPDIDQLRPGLNIIAESDVALSAAYVANGRVVYVESLAGAPKQAIYQLGAPEEPANEMDYRLVDQNGITFFAERGGDEWLDPSWRADIEIAENTVVDMAEREIDFQVAQQAGLAMAAHPSVAVRTHGFHVAELAPVTSFTAMAQGAHHQTNVDVAYSTTGTGGKWGDAYKKCVDFLCVGYHTAVQFTNSSTGVVIVNFSNHGTSPGGMGAPTSYYCWSSGSSDVSGENLDSTSVGAAGSNGCSTPYHWSSKDNRHLCNDDTLFELKQLKGAASPSQHTSFSASDGYDTYSCNGYSCSGHWAWPSCP